ncbi:hypothetical protein TNCV_4688761 [Trichonephila clavipes]|nr:hypothetical protein TNCV_4688761 [Trichonephila clavipes]
MHLAIWRLFDEENHKMFLVPGKSSRNREIRKIEIEEGRKITDVAREFDIAHSVVSRLWKSFKTTGMCSRRHGADRFRSTTPADDDDDDDC